MAHHIIPAIMSGGSGTRLWPASTAQLPKQFLRMFGADSLIQATLKRTQSDAGAIRFTAPIILANTRHEALIDEHLAQIGVGASAIALEPEGRNTAAAAAIAAMLAREQDSQALVLLLPADHMISDTGAFHAAIARAAPFARDRILTFGITPNRPATNYGYIKQGQDLGDGVFEIGAFKEKPEAETAQAYLQAGGYSWNAGIFLFSPAVLLREFAAVQDISDASAAALASARRAGGKIYFDATAFQRIPAAPIDIAVMEKTQWGAVLPCDIGWADVGAWDEVHRLSPQDGAGNANHGAVITIDTENSYFRSEGPGIYACGVQDLIVIATPEAVVIVPRDRAQDVKALLDKAKAPR